VKLTSQQLKQVILEVLVEDESGLMAVESAEMFVRNMRPENIFIEPMSFKKGSAYWQWDQIARAMDFPHRHPRSVIEEISAMMKLIDSPEIKDEKRGEIEKVLLSLMYRADDET